MTAYAYKWTVGGFDVEQPEAAANPKRQFIDMPRGCVSGFAQFYLRTKDAKAVLGQSSVEIVAKIFEREDEGDTEAEWTQKDTMTWSEFIPVEIAEENQLGFALVILRDKRHKLDRAVKAKIWNQVRYVTFTGSGAETVTYEPLYRNGLVPWTYQEIVTELLGSFSAPALPASGSDNPKNLQSTGTVAAALDGIAASLGYAMGLDKDGSVSWVDVGDMTVPSAVEEARKDRLIAVTDDDIERHGKLTVWPVKYYPNHPKSSSTSFGDGGQAEVIIIDHELADKNVGVLSGRMTAIQGVVEKWYKAEKDGFDETFYGLLDVAPGIGVTQVTWYLSDATHGHETRVRCYSPPIPWPERTEPPPPTPLWGKTFNTIGVDSTGEVFIDQPSGGGWTTTTILQFVHNRVSSIAANKRVLLEPIDDRWCVLEVC